jgi:flagellar L-ring protein precursor FlgH
MKLFIGLMVAAVCAEGARKAKAPQPTPLDLYVNEAMTRESDAAISQPGSLWSPSAALGALAGDLRARNVDDIVTVIVLDQASALAKGTTKSARSSSAQASISSLSGPLSGTGRLANLADLSSQTQLDGQGETSRETLLSTKLSARVTHVLPNGYLVVQGTKNVVVNSEVQTVTVRGVLRPVDLGAGNAVFSEQLGQLEVQVNGKGVVGDAIRRPHFLYRLLLGVLPF